MKEKDPSPVNVLGLVTTTDCAPAEPVGVVAVIEVELTHVTPVAAAPPIVTVAPDTKPVPVIVIATPPASVPLDGDTEITVGATAYVKAPVPVPDRLLGFVTMTFCAPAVPAGAMTVIDVALTHVTPVAAVPPMVTVAPDTNPVPVIVTEVPPTVAPMSGGTEVTVGGKAT